MKKELNMVMSIILTENPEACKVNQPCIFSAGYLVGVMCYKVNNFWRLV